MKLDLHLRSTAYCWGNFTGPFVVKASEAPTYPTATAGLLAGYSVKLGCHLLLLGKTSYYFATLSILRLTIYFQDTCFL